MTDQRPPTADASGLATTPRTLIVTLASEGTAIPADLEAFGRLIADEVARHEAARWRVISASVLTLPRSGEEATTTLGAVLVLQQYT